MVTFYQATPKSIWELGWVSGLIGVVVGFGLNFVAQEFKAWRDKKANFHACVIRLYIETMELEAAFHIFFVKWEAVTESCRTLRLQEGEMDSDGNVVRSISEMTSNTDLQVWKLNITHENFKAGLSELMRFAGFDPRCPELAEQLGDLSYRVWAMIDWTRFKDAAFRVDETTFDELEKDGELVAREYGDIREDLHIFGENCILLTETPGLLARMRAVIFRRPITLSSIQPLTDSSKTDQAEEIV